MKILTVFAHPASRSFCHAVLERFDAGLRESGHTNEILDLYAIGFDPILRERDNPSWLTETIPDEMLERMRLRENLLEQAGGPLKRFALKRLIGDRDARGIIRLLRERASRASSTSTSTPSTAPTMLRGRAIWSAHMRWVASSEGTADHRPLAGVEGFSQTHTLTIVVAEVLNAVWMTWLLVVAWQMPHPKRLSPGR